MMNRWQCNWDDPDTHRARPAEIGSGSGGWICKNTLSSAARAEVRGRGALVATRQPGGAWLPVGASFDLISRTMFGLVLICPHLVELGASHSVLVQVRVNKGCPNYVIWANFLISNSQE